MRIIAFCGPKSSGKDTAAKTLFRHNEGYRKELFLHCPMAEGVKNICSDFFGWSFEQMQDFDFKETPIELWPNGPVMAARWPMMDIANWLRDKYGGAIHAERWARRVSQAEEAKLNSRDGTGWGAYVTTDLRFPEELDTFQRIADNNLLVIYVERATSESALAEKQQAGDAMALNPSEAHYAMLKEYAQTHGVVIHNNQHIENLSNEVNNAVKNFFGHWQYWTDTAPFLHTDDFLTKLRTGQI